MRRCFLFVLFFCLAALPLTAAEQVRALVWSPDGALLAVMTEGTVRLYDTIDWNAPPHIIDSRSGAFAGAAFSPDSSMLALVSHNYAPGSRKLDSAEVILWERSSGTTRLVLRGHSDLIVQLAFNADGSSLATAAQDQQIRVWDTTTGALLRQLETGLRFFNDLAFNAEGVLLVAGSNDILLESSYQHVIQQWDTTQDTMQTFAPMDYESIVYTIEFSPDGAWAAVSLEDGLAFWDIQRQSLTKILRAENAVGAYVLTFSADTSTLAAAYLVGDGAETTGGLIEVWSLVSGNVQVVFEDITGLLALSPGGGRLAVASFDGGVEVIALIDGGRTRLQL